MENRILRACCLQELRRSYSLKPLYLPGWTSFFREHCHQKPLKCLSDISSVRSSSFTCVTGTKGLGARNILVPPVERQSTKREEKRNNKKRQSIPWVAKHPSSLDDNLPEEGLARAAWKWVLAVCMFPGWAMEIVRLCTWRWRWRILSRDGKRRQEKKC